MYNFLTKNGQSLAFGLGVLVTVIFLVNVLTGLDQFSSLPKEEQTSTTIFNLGLSGAIALAVIAALGMVLFGVFQVVGNFKSSVKGIIGFGLLLGIFFVAYTMASGEATGVIKEAVDKTGGGLSPGNLKFISAGISTALTLVALAALAFVLSELRNFFK